MEAMIDLHAADIDERRTPFFCAPRRNGAKLHSNWRRKNDGPSMLRANGCNDPRRPVSVMPPAWSTAKDTSYLFAAWVISRSRTVLI
jgi:hypothetical protein